MATTVRKIDIDTNGDGRVSKQEWNSYKRRVDNTKKPRESRDIDAKFSDKDFESLTHRLGGDFAAAGEIWGPQDEAERMLRGLDGRITSGMSALEAAMHTKREMDAQKLKHEMQKMITEAEFLNTKASTSKQLDLASTREKMEKILPDPPKEMKTIKAQVLSQKSADPMSQRMAKAISLPPGWGDSSGGAQFNANVYAQTLAMEDSTMQAFEDIGKNSNRGKQLMMLFFYFAKMAESGDMGAMYQFMKFITYIVSKDKAKQQIEMGKKLIQLQDLSRQWTNKLLNLQTDSNDPNSSNELMKTMTIVKSETDSIATSQKLISQMMEEFSQVVETLTNVTKAALETEGRILRRVSSPQ